MNRQREIPAKIAKPTAAGKQSYRTPVLAAHGNLRTLAQAKGSSNNDGSGKPRTKAGGPAA